jgi:hypothetical protein
MVTPDIIQSILNQIASGSTMRRACKDHGVAHSTFWDAVDQDEALSGQYARAINCGCDAQADEILDLADSAQGLDNDGVQAVRLAVDSRKWLLSKRSRKYADKITQELTGMNGGPLATAVTVSYVPAALSVQRALPDKQDDCA